MISENWKKANLRRAMLTFEAAKKLARDNRMVLRQCTDYHFQLQDLQTGWLKNLYPTNGRIYGDRHRRGPYISVPKYWNFLEVVEAAIAARR